MTRTPKYAPNQPVEILPPESNKWLAGVVIGKGAGKRLLVKVTESDRIWHGAELFVGCGENNAQVRVV